ncbi:hypothetical protein LP419_35445 [Massilia sp. H-1]|nr:hypothetical protein LP419_35445 [Massilia sp. H-1]
MHLMTVFIAVGEDQSFAAASRKLSLSCGRRDARHRQPRNAAGGQAAGPHHAQRAPD